MREDRSYSIIQEDVKDVVSRLGKKTKEFEGCTFLVTGASGLIGSYFLDVISFLNDSKFTRSCKVLALQRSDPRKSPRLKHLLNRKDISFIPHDVRYPYKPRIAIDYIIHSAGMSAPALFQADPLGTVDVNVNGIRWVLEYANCHKVKSILYMSSGETYGKPNPENIPTPETYNGNVSPLDTRSCYAESKRLAETLCSIYHRLFKVPVKIARPFATYGPGMTLKDRRVIADFIRSGISGKPIEMLTKGADTRTFCYISDATLAFFKILLSDLNGEAFNVASDEEEISIRKLASTIHSICGIKESVKISPSGRTDFLKDAPVRTYPDISKIRKMLKYKPTVNLREGLIRTIDWNRAALY